MEFYLINEKAIYFYSDSSSLVKFTTDLVTRKRKCTDKLPLILKAVTGGTPSTVGPEVSADGGTPLDSHFVGNLMNLLAKNYAKDNGTLTKGNELTLSVDLQLTITSLMTGSLKILISEKEESIFKALRSTLPENSYGFNLVVNSFYGDDDEGNESSQFQFEGKNLKVTKLECGNSGMEVGFAGLPEDMRDWWMERNACFQGTCTLTLRLDPPAVSMVYLEGLPKNQFTDWSINLLKEGTASDLVIVAGDTDTKDKEKAIKCHKCILSGRSPVFTAMFQSGMSECRDNCVEIKDMTEAGVKALLQFIYGWDLEEASKDCGIALELLKAGEKYQMEDLVEAMERLICAMSCQWFSVDVAIKLMLHTLSVQGGKLGQVEKKCWTILKWHAQTSTETLLASQEYQKLVREDPQTTMLLGAKLLKMI